MQSSSKAFLFVTVELDIAADSILNSTIFTLVYFIKADDQAGGAVNRLTSRNGFNFETAIGNLNGNTGELLSFNIDDGSWVTTGTTVEMNGRTWRHIAWVSNGTDLELFVDGASAGVIPGGAPQALAGFMHVGANHVSTFGTEGFVGNMDDVALFDTALDSSDVSFISNNGVVASILLLGLGGLVVPTRRRS